MPQRSVIVLLIIWGLGCAPANREELAKQVLAVDPDFGAVLEKHRELSSRIETFQKELALKRSTTERAIAQMRRDLAAAAASVRARATETKKRMEPDQQRLELVLSVSSEELRTKRLQRASLGRTITQLRKSLNSKDAPWTTEERARQQAQLDESLRDASRLDQELQVLNEHVRLLKIKLLLIKL